MGDAYKVIQWHVLHDFRIVEDSNKSKRIYITGIRTFKELLWDGLG